MPALKDNRTQFLNTVLQQIKYRKIHPEISAELNSHIDELIEQYVSSGMDQDKAEEKAIRQMGDPVIIGAKLHKQHKPKTDWFLISLTALLLCFSAFSLMAGESSIFANRKINFLIYLPAGIAALIACYFLDYSKVQKWSLALYAAAAVLVWGTILFCPSINGRPYLTVGSLSFNPSIVATPLFLISFAGLIIRYQGQGWSAIIKLAVFCLFSVLTMMEYPSLSSALILVICYAVVWTIAIVKGNFQGSRTPYLLALYGAGLVVCLFLLVQLQPLESSRFTAFLDHGASDPTGYGWINYTLHQVLSSARFIGNSAVLPETVLPESQTDFVFANIVSHGGWLMGILLVLIVAAVIVRMFFLTRKVRHLYGYYLALSACILLSVQFIANILMNLNLIPLFAISMPFISYGGSGFVVSMALMGIVLSVWRYHLIIKPPVVPAANSPSGKWIFFQDGKLVIDFKK